MAVTTRNGASPFREHFAESFKGQVWNSYKLPAHVEISDDFRRMFNSEAHQAELRYHLELGSQLWPLATPAFPCPTCHEIQWELTGAWHGREVRVVTSGGSLGLQAPSPVRACLASCVINRHHTLAPDT